MANRLAFILTILTLISVSAFVFDNADSDSQDSLTSLFFNIFNWSLSSTVNFFWSLAIGSAGAAAVYYASAFLFKSQDALFAPTAAAVILLGGSGLVTLYNFIYREVGVFGDANGFIASLVTFPLAFYFLWQVVAWWRGNPEL